MQSALLKYNIDFQILLIEMLAGRFFRILKTSKNELNFVKIYQLKNFLIHCTIQLLYD